MERSHQLHRIPQNVFIDITIQRRRPDVPMPHQLLNRPHPYALRIESRGKRPSSGVRCSNPCQVVYLLEEHAQRDIREGAPIALGELATMHGLHPTQIAAWKRQAIEKLAQVFDEKAARASKTAMQR
jgi:hypothetical protein